MLALLRLRPSAPVAASILREVFAPLRRPLAFRLWDGTEVRVGQGEPPCVVVFRSSETFVDLMRDPSPGHFAEAYASDRIDIQGDLFAAMYVADEVEEIKLTVGQRLRILRSLWASS
jgi:cyclopropane-fatty-acyl-phospholipid synthase